MKTKTLNFEDFKVNQLPAEQCKLIKCGIDDKPKPVPVVRPGSGATGSSVICYYDFEGELLYCVYKEVI